MTDSELLVHLLISIVVGVVLGLLFAIIEDALRNHKRIFHKYKIIMKVPNDSKGQWLEAPSFIAVKNIGGLFPKWDILREDSSVSYLYRIIIDDIHNPESRIPQPLGKCEKGYKYLTFATID